MTKKQKPIITSPKTFTLADTIVDKPAPEPQDPIEGELTPAPLNTPQTTPEPDQPPVALRARQQAFVDAYLIDPNATKAAIAAGYSPKTAQQIGSENLLKPVIKAAIDEGLAELSAASRVDAQYVLDKAKAGVEICGREVPVLDSEGAQVPGSKLVDAANYYKGLDMLAKYVGLYDKDNKQLAGDGVTKEIRVIFEDGLSKFSDT